MKQFMSRLSQWWTKGSAPRWQLPNRFVPCFDMLEDRTVPVGNITSTFSGNTLTLTAANDFSVSGNNNQFLGIFGAGAGAVTVDNFGAETIIGPAAGGATVGNVVNPVKNIKLVMNLGADVVFLSGCQIAGNVTFQGGDGNNVLALESGCTVGSVTVTNGDGADTFETASGTNTIVGNLSINNGVGDSTTNLGVNAGDITNIGGVTITNGAGNDTLSTNSADSLNIITAAGKPGNFTVNNGNGGSSTSLVCPISLNVGALSITNAAGLDDETIGSTTGGSTMALGAVTIKNGSGDSNTTIHSSNISPPTGTLASLSITNGDGFDDITLDTIVVVKSVNINNGNGGSTVDILTSHVGTPTVKGTLTITCGDGNDDITLDAPLVDAITVFGTTTIKTGNGDDTVTIQDAVLAGTNIDTGAGNDTVNLEKVTDGFPSNFVSLKVTMDSGDDTLNLNSSGDGFNVTGSTKTIFDGGTGFDTINAPAGPPTFGENYVAGVTTSNFEVL